ncbi:MULTISPECIES: ABC transporter substrate-binding protein [unclassified Azospirillum]|uniref:ABC transporter substrate-binding protein n=1 Tax=unclassified Azospirillum TaxID=2630922 RepID=UPI000B6A4947|nr:MULTISPECIES: ABC transporter substrate-binding protein [unclassified Azospirillum]SNS87659.1 NitT/TauT family transport system substrate-binding protein [Azospirillum sp. RU38E]SNT04610.1 NitT/TauT family transport system substrate-binding protein [Azospirillum sp. RU37A]
MLPIVSRRAFMAGAAALASLPVQGAAAALRLGLLPFGTVQWEMATAQAHGLDRTAGLTLSVQELAGTQAAQVALLGGAVDVIAADWLWVARQRAAGIGLSFIPYSCSVGSIIVPADSPIRSTADLAGRRLGIAGGPVDKGWLLLRAQAAQRYGLDLATSVTPLFAAPPLLSHELQAGRLDAVLTYWHYAARLEAAGQRQLASVAELAHDLGLRREVPALGYVFRDDWASRNRESLTAFAQISRQAKAILARDDAAWTSLRPPLAAEDDATARLLRDRFRQGIPQRWTEAERADAARLFALLAQLGGRELVGDAATIPDGTFWPISWG